MNGIGTTSIDADRLRGVLATAFHLPDREVEALEREHHAGGRGAWDEDEIDRLASVLAMRFFKVKGGRAEYRAGISSVFQTYFKYALAFDRPSKDTWAFALDLLGANYLRPEDAARLREAGERDVPAPDAKDPTWKAWYARAFDGLRKDARMRIGPFETEHLREYYREMGKGLAFRVAPSNVPFLALFLSDMNRIITADRLLPEILKDHPAVRAFAPLSGIVKMKKRVNLSDRHTEAAA